MSALGLPDKAIPDSSIPLREIAAAIASVRHGYVHLVIQDSRVVQIDKTEKTRLEAPRQDKGQRSKRS